MKGIHCLHKIMRNPLSLDDSAPPSLASGIHPYGPPWLWSSTPKNPLQDGNKRMDTKEHMHTPRQFCGPLHWTEFIHIAAANGQRDSEKTLFLSGKQHAYLEVGALLLRKRKLVLEGKWLLKCRFCYYSDMVGPTDQEMTVIQKIVCYTCRF